MLETTQILQDRYQLERQLGRTGTGRQTWLATDRQTEEWVVLKLLAFNPQLQWEEVKLFERESRILQHLDHVRIPHYRDYFALEAAIGGGLPWFVLVQDYIPGKSLQEWLDQGQCLTETQAHCLAEDLLEILIYLHELSPTVLHRDIKPSNIILNQKRFYLVDFGAVQERAKAEGASFTVVGTSGYAAPEQLWGRAIPASDLYGLGTTLIHLLTGIAPADLPQRQLRLQFRDRVTISPPFASWLDRLVAPAAEQRFSTAQQALRSLRQGQIQPTSVAPPQTIRYGRLIVASCVGLGILALLGWGVMAILSLLTLDID